MYIYINVNENNIITGWSDTKLDNSMYVETDLNVNDIELPYNYRINNGIIIELLDSEKPSIEIPPNKTEILEQEVSRLEIEMLKMKKGMI